MFDRLPKLKDRSPKEAEITREIRAYLKMKGIFNWKVHQGLGSTPGCPDILGCYKGRLLGIEVKTHKGKATEHQKNFIDRINFEGGLAFVARSIEDVDRALKEEVCHDRYEL